MDVGLTIHDPAIVECRANEITKRTTITGLSFNIVVIPVRVNNSSGNPSRELPYRNGATTGHHRRKIYRALRVALAIETAVQGIQLLDDFVAKIIGWPNGVSAIPIEVSNIAAREVLFFPLAADLAKCPVP